jgi:hypothetical protein
VASASTHDHDPKKHRAGGGGRGSGSRGKGSPAGGKDIWGQMVRSGNRVKGKVEGLHYGPTCWKLMTTAQQVEAIKLRKQKSALNASLASSQQQQIDARKHQVAEMSSNGESSRSHEREHSSRSLLRRCSRSRCTITLLVPLPIADG